jgi:hypothetical protein
MPKQETRKCQRELSPVSKADVMNVVDVVDGVDVMHYARNCHRKTLFSLLLDVA